MQFPGDSDGSFTVTAQNPDGRHQAPPDTEFVLTMTQANTAGKG